MLSESGFLEGMFSLQFKEGSKPYQMPPGCMSYVGNNILKKKLECPQSQQIIIPLGVNGTSQWCNSFILVPKPSEKVGFCLDPARFNQALII